MSREPRPSGARADDAIGFLLWHDCWDRFAILTLEIRHFQCNLIHALSEPVLYRPLRFEERYLWGQYDGRETSWTDIFEGDGLRKSDIYALACRWVIGYPRHDEPEGGNNDSSDRIQWGLLTKYVKEEERGNIIGQISTRLDEIWVHGLWSQDARRYYQTLCASQIIKTHALQDALALCCAADGAFGHYPSKADNNGDKYDPLADFLLVRSVVLRRLREHVERLGDLQAQLERTLDLQLQEHPRPILGRRREQGMYSSFLSERCFDIYAEVDDLMTRFGRPPVGTKRAERFSTCNLTPLTMHRWQHAHTSSCKYVANTLSTPRDRGSRDDIHFVTTSYWMPDRPDLQVVIAHEVSHNLIQERYGTLSPESLPLYPDKFARLMRLLFHCMERSGLTRVDPCVPPRYYPDLTLREVACDLLAASIYDYGYLFALCQEIFGVGLEEQFVDPLGNYDLRMAEVALCANDVEREWYYRLRIVCAWLDAIEDKDKRSPLAKTLIDGINGILSRVARYINTRTPGPELLYWETVTDRMCRIVGRSEVAGVVRRWRTERRAQNDDLDRGAPIFRRMSRHAGRLPKDVRWFLYKALIHRKTSPYRALSFFQEREFDNETVYSLYKHFETFYFDRVSETGRPEIFRHLHDIPWETHVLRAKDFVHSGAPGYNVLGRRQWLVAAIRHSSPGRALYEVALELHYWRVRSPNDRLSSAIRLLDGKTELPGITDWLGQSEEPAQNAVDALYSEIGRYLNSGLTYRPEELRTILGNRRFTPRVLMLAHPYNLATCRDVTNNDMVALEYLQGRKLEELLGILKKREAAELQPLASFLGLRTQQISPKSPLSKRLQELLPVFSKAPYENGGHVNWKIGLPDLENYSLSRISVSGSNDGGGGGSNSALSLKDSVSRSVWSEEGAFDPGAWRDGEEQSRARLFQCVLGTHDIVGISMSPPPWRWSLPVFPSNKSEVAPSGEQFAPFFERREGAFLLRHGRYAPRRRPQSRLGFIAIRLCQRAVRMDFFSRLLQKTTRKEGESERVETIGNMLRDDDEIYLGQGWGDFVIAFSASKKSESRLRQIFQMQNTLYEDFMVDRTEIILSSQSLSLAAETGDYRVIVQCRVKEGRGLSHSNAELMEELMFGLQEMDIEVLRTPGRTDFTLIFNDLTIFSNARANPVGEVLELFGAAVSQVDELTTTIGIKGGK